MWQKKWDIPHIPELPNIPKSNVLPLWQKKNSISRFVCQYPKIITIFDVADFKRDMIMIFFFIIYMIIGLIVRFKIFNIIYRSQNSKDTKSRKHQSHETEHLLVCSNDLFIFYVVEYGVPIWVSICELLFNFNFFRSVIVVIWSIFYRSLVWVI